MLFGKKSRQVNENEILLKKLDGREIKYATLRDPVDYGEMIIGRDGVINIIDNELVVVCRNSIVFRQPLNNIQAGELMSLDGVTLKFKEQDNSRYLTLIAYYKYYRK